MSFRVLSFIFLCFLFSSKFTWAAKDHEGNGRASDGTDYCYNGGCPGNGSNNSGVSQYWADGSKSWVDVCGGGACDLFCCTTASS